MNLEYSHSTATWFGHRSSSIALWKATVELEKEENENIEAVLMRSLLRSEGVQHLDEVLRDLQHEEFHRVHGDARRPVPGDGRLANVRIRRVANVKKTVKCWLRCERKEPPPAGKVEKPELPLKQPQTRMAQSGLEVQNRV